jgi:tRNA-intron endonuclease
MNAHILTVSSYLVIFPMLIWKSSIFLNNMDEGIEVSGDLILDQACISEHKMIHDLEQKGFGEITKGKLFLKSFETLYLLYTRKLFLKKNKKQIDFDTFMNICQKTNPEILTKFLIFRDLKTRGYVVKDGFGFGSDFRVYERGHFGEKGAKFLIFGLNEGQQEKMGALQKKIDEITQMGKEPIIAVIERRGEVIYYKINKMNFLENKSRLEGNFEF